MIAWVSVTLALIVTCLWMPGGAWAQERHQGGAPQFGGTYRRPLPDSPSTLDPARLSDTHGHTVANQIFDSLVQYDGSLTILPALAEDWTASRNGLHWTFRLRKGVRFHNGREVTADDVVYSYTRIIDPRTKSKAAEYFMKVQGAKEFVEGRARSVAGLVALDRHTVQINLTEASTPFVLTLAVGWAKIVPREAVEHAGDAFGKQPVGSGPFRFVRWTKDEIVLEAFREYYGGRPFLDRVEYKIFSGHNLDSMFASFEQEAIEDSLIPSAVIQQVQSNNKYHFIRRPMLRVLFFGFNTAEGPMANKLVRQAFSCAIDREAMAREIIKGRDKAGQSFLPPGVYGYDPQFRPYPYDPQRARTLLAKAGHPEGRNLPPLQLWSSVKSSDVEREHEAMKGYLAEVGIRAEFRYHTNWPEFKTMVQDGKLPIFRWGWSADMPDPENFLYMLFHSQGRTNIFQYRNPTVDRLLDRARAEQAYLKRIELFREAEQLIMEDAPVFPIRYSTYERVFQPYVQSIEVTALGDPYIPMRKIWLAK